MNFLLRLFLTFSSVSFFIVVFLVQNQIIPYKCILYRYDWVVYLIYLTLPFILASISLWLSSFLSKSTIKKIYSIEPSNNDFLANYLAFFFVALSIKEMTTFWIVFGMTIVFTFVSRVSYFNPIFLVFGYNFYYVHINDNSKVMLISKKNIKNPNSFNETQAGRINDYTFIEG